jgi:hypothetical protein
LIRERGKLFGYVKVPDPESAIIEQFEIQEFRAATAPRTAHGLIAALALFARALFRPGCGSTVSMKKRTVRQHCERGEGQSQRVDTKALWQALKSVRSGVEIRRLDRTRTVKTSVFFRGEKPFGGRDLGFGALSKSSSRFEPLHFYWTALDLGLRARTWPSVNGCVPAGVMIRCMRLCGACSSGFVLTQILANAA